MRHRGRGLTYPEDAGRSRRVESQDTKRKRRSEEPKGTKRGKRRSEEPKGTKWRKRQKDKETREKRSGTGCREHQRGHCLKKTEREIDI
ncbi:hypothetical protein NDU88_006571 [Pleurodeles waltl]|uniref:Uncharacterized protein n=1 Tax=Pleurodeles waltl TaxID=8319 RepID=A0AAV7WEE6_PLEWA|nr:hypothetical protein NDU88_006571 [Pleurodeles waltl]